MSDPAALSLAVREIIDLEQARLDIQINPRDIDTALAEHASFATHYGELMARAQAQVSSFERLRKTYAAKLDSKLRSAFLDRGEKVTETKIEAAKDADPNLMMIDKCIIQAQEQLGLCETYAYSFRQRKDTLIGLANNMRQERSGELAVYTAEAEAARQERRRLQVTDIQNRLAPPAS